MAGTVTYGCVNRAGEDNRNVARMCALLAGLPVSVAASTVNRLCGSGLDAVGSTARAVACGAVDLAVAGGVESMSRAPFVMPEAPTPFGRHAELHDSIIGWRFVNPRMPALHGTDSMGETAENVASEHGLNRADQDAIALRSKQRAARAVAAAGSLNLSDRALGRQLAHVGLSYRYLLDESRKSRAFKRWTGHPPSLVRGFVETWVDA